MTIDLNKKVYKTIGAVALALSIFWGGTVLFLTERTKDYSDQNQIDSISENIDCDLSYLKGPTAAKIVRMKHNNDEPIYVSISDKYSTEEKAYIQWSLDYIFGVVGSINSHYTYKIVDESERESHSKIGKTTIFYDVKEINYETKLGNDRANGSITCEKDFLSKISGKPLYNSYSICYDREIHKNDSPEHKQYTFMHELLHAFGFGDVYNRTEQFSYTSKFHGNTVMNTTIGNKINCLTPNDYRALIAAYAPKMNSEQLVQFINEYVQKISDYDSFYYRTLSALCEYNLGTESDLDTSQNYILSHTFQVVDQEESIVENLYITIRDGKYYLSIVDKNNNLIDSADGEIFDTGHSFVLKNVKLKKGLRPLFEGGNLSEYINDFVLVKKDGRIILYDISKNKEVSMSYEATKPAKSNESSFEQ